MLPISLPLHHSEPGDPVLLEWIRHQIELLVGLGPAAIVVFLALVILAIPTVIMGAYLVQGRRRAK